MNITLQDNGNHTALIQIQLTETDYTNSVENQLNDYKKKASLHGFRPGKVPMGLIRKMYGKAVLAEEINKIVSDSLNNYLSEKKLRIIGQPIPNMEKNNTIDFDTQKSFDFYFDLGFAPEFDLQFIDELEVPYYSIKVSEDQINKAIQDIKVRYGSEEYPEKAELTDGLQGMFAEIDNEGNLIEGGINQAGFFRLEDIKSKAEQKKLINTAIGETNDMKLTELFGDEAKVKSLLHLHEVDEAKLKSMYRFTLEKIIRMKEAEIGEELFKRVFPSDDIKTEAELRDRISLDIKNHFQRDSDQQFLSDSTNKIIETAQLELPDEFLKKLLFNSNEGNLTLEQIDKDYDIYAKTYRWQLIEGKLKEKNGELLIVTAEDVRNKVRSYFTSMGGSVDNPQVESIIDSILKNREEFQRIYFDLSNERMISFLKEKVKKIGKEVDQEEFYQIVSNTN